MFTYIWIQCFHKRQENHLYINVLIYIVLNIYELDQAKKYNSILKCKRCKGVQHVTKRTTQLVMNNETRVEQLSELLVVVL